MEIRPSVPLLPNQTSAKGISNLIAQLRPGQNLVAVVETRLAENTFLLKLADSGRSISARTQLDLAPGQMLKLEVVSLGPTPELKIVPQTETEPSEAEAMQQALRQFMPKQQGLAELASTLRQALTQQAVKNASDLPEPLRALIRTVLDGLPQKKALLNAEGLRQAARNSGIFFEAHLAAHPSSLQSVSARDLKCRLMTLSDALQGILATDADSEQGAASPSDDGRVTVGTPPDGSKAQLDSAKTSTRTAATLQQGSTGDGEPTSSLPAGARAETAEMSAKLSAGGEKPAESTAPPKLGMAQTGSQLQESPQSVKGGIGQPVESSGAELPESTTLGPAKMSPEDKNSAIQSQGKADAGLAMAGKSATENGTTIATGSGADKSAPAADGRAPQAPAGQRAPSEMEIAPRLLTPEPPGTNTTASTAAERFQDIPPATSSAVAEKGIGTNFSEQGPRADLPSPREGSDRLGTTLLADSPEATVSLKTLQQHAEGALARIVLDQLASLPQGDGKQLVWQMEIPFVDEGRSDSAKFKIIREERSGGAQSGQPYWSAVLELSPPGLGTIHSRITLWGERVDTYFWSDLNSTSALIQDNLDLLAARLQQAGLEIGQLNALPGTPHGAKIEAAQSCKLVDERA